MYHRIPTYAPSAAMMIPPPIAAHRPAPFFAPALPPLSVANQALLESVIPPPPPEPFILRLESWFEAWLRTLERWPAQVVSWFRADTHQT